MKYKTLLISLALWFLSIILIFYGIFGVKFIGYPISAVIIPIGLFINPSFSIMLKKRLFFETTSLMKAIAVIAVFLLFLLIRFHVISIPRKEATYSTETTTVSMSAATSAATTDVTTG